VRVKILERQLVEAILGYAESVDIDDFKEEYWLIVLDKFLTPGQIGCLEANLNFVSKDKSEAEMCDVHVKSAGKNILS
jgi:hypothetical protein